MTSISDIRKAFKDSTLLNLRAQIEGLDGALGTFEMFFGELEHSFDQSDGKFKNVLLQAEKEFGNVQKVV